MYCAKCCMYCKWHLKEHYVQHHAIEEGTTKTLSSLKKKPYHYYKPGEAPTGDPYCKNWVEVGDDQIGSSSWVSRF